MNDDNKISDADLEGVAGGKGKKDVDYETMKKKKLAAQEGAGDFKPMPGGSKDRKDTPDISTK